MPDIKDYLDTETPYDVFKFLVDKGYTLQQRTFYNHVKAGKLRRNKDGVFTRRMVEEYINTWIKPRYWPQDGGGARTQDQGAGGVGDDSDLTMRKLKAEVLKLEAAGSKAVYELDILQGKYLLKDDVYRELAGRAVILAAGYQHMVYTKAASWIALAGGDHSRLDVVVAQILEDQDELLNSFADDSNYMVNIVE